MFVSNNIKYFTSNESNIPVPKRKTYKRPTKKTNKLPQIQKYIETIVKASNDYGYDKRNKITGAKKISNSEKLSAKGVENENKHEAIKENDCLSNEKTKNKAKTETKASIEKGKGEEDDTFLSSEMEKRLQKLYPNPYDLGNVNEFRDMITKRKRERSLGKENVVVTADIEIKEKGGCEQPDNCIVSLSFKDEDENTRVSDCFGRKVSTIWFKNLSVDDKTSTKDRTHTENWDIANQTLYQPNELDDLRRIYDMMDKATESFRALSCRSAKASENAKKNNNIVQFLSDLNIKNPVIQTEKMKKLRNNAAGRVERLHKHKNYEQCEGKHCGAVGNKNTLKLKTIRKPESKSTSNDFWRSVSVDVNPTPEEMNDRELNETSRKIDEVLEFMYSCLLKFKEDDQKSCTRNVSTSIANTPGEVVGDVDTHNLETPVDEITVESQNELGGYTEETVVVACEEQRHPRPVLPLSAKIRKRKDDSYEVIKKALEAEEKLLAQNPTRKEVFTGGVLGCQVGLQELRFLNEVPKRSFVICVNSLPRSLRTVNTSSMALSSLSISLSDTNNYCCVKELNRPKHELEELCIAQTPSQRVCILSYRLQEERLLHTTTNNTFGIICNICFPKILTNPRQEEVSVMSIQWVEALKTDTEPVYALREAVEETEECMYLLERKSSLSHEQDNPEDKKEAGDDKERVQELLLRTYNLQTKLHDYLYKINGEPSTGRPETIDKGVSCEDTADSDIRDSIVHWFLESDQKDSGKVDHATSYHVQVDNRCCQTKPDEDDRSSVSSFKSSNDFSEEESKQQPNNFLKKIFSEIKLFKRNKETNKTQVVEYKGDPKPPAKVLKTIFKGKDSMTELTIGLKDVPMTHVNNISVEKKKYSQNHTKISICIAKELESPSYYLEETKPSSQLEDETDPESDDDFQSVTSSLSNTEIKIDPEEEEAQTEPKKNPKHRFEFYHKMSTNYDLENKAPVHAVCRYKALEPLKQALTDMQMKMRSIRKNSYYNNNEYYKRALKLAKMSTGFCQNCGNRAVIPENTFGCYKSVLPERCSSHRRGCYFNKTAPTSNFYSFRASGGDISDHYFDLSSSYLCNSHPRSNRSLVKDPLHDIPIIFGGI